MFLCKKCHNIEDHICHLEKEMLHSHGRCEACNKVSDCVDCRSHHRGINPKYKDLDRKIDKAMKMLVRSTKEREVAVVPRRSRKPGTRKRRGSTPPRSSKKDSRKR